jgi:hypothetical protein
MKEKEQIEKCWDEFLRDEIHYSNQLEHMGYEAVFKAGFMAAKRNMPVIELPKPEDMYDKGDQWMGRFFADGYIHNALTGAGIKYTIKGE